MRNPRIHSARLPVTPVRRTSLPALLPALLAALVVPWLAASAALAGVGSPGTGDLPVPGDFDGETTTVAFVDRDLLLVHFDCITQPPPPDPIGPVVILFAADWDGDRRDEVVGFDQPSCSYIQPADVCDVFGPDPQPWDPDPVSWNVIAGDWNGDGRDTLAVYDPATCETVPLAEAAAESLILPEAGTWSFLAGDWEGRGEPTVAIARPHGCGAGDSSLLAGRWDGDHDSLGAVQEDGTAVLWDLDTDLATALQSEEATMPEPGEACLDFEIQCWTINIPGLGSSKLCHRRRCCLGTGCYDYFDNK